MPKLCSAVGAEGWPQPEPSRGKSPFNASAPKPPTLLNLLPGALRSSGIHKNPEAASPQTLWQWNCAPPERAVCYLKPHKTQHTSHHPHHTSLCTNTTTDFLTTVSRSFFLSRVGEKTCPNIFLYITIKLEECFMFSIYFQFTAMVSILVAMCIL